jgi:predicted nucleotidyltransferase
MKDQKEIIVSMIRKLVKEIDPTAKIILFGSRARGDERPDSDWDIIILIDSKADIDTEKIFRHKLFDLELETGVAISTFVYNKYEWNSKYRITPLYKNVSREGIII